MRRGEELEDIGFLAECEPPSSFSRCFALYSHKVMLGHLNNSWTHHYELALRKHRKELLAREDLNPKLRKYIKKHIPE
ncbi:MAG: hypothetical protein KJ600_02985 [Nanoarchaeota archaeon]|nr:hypothetical protein [Nanoarchaeota archaeon]MBU1103494.1 hypothetical protein [Nanoarchaeota archaeon]